MKILAAIIAHPLRKVSGATNAARDLTEAIAPLADIELAIMWDRTETAVHQGVTTHYLKCWNWLSAAAGVVPRFASVPLYDSDMPELACSGRYDLVHIHNLIPSFAAQRLAAACRKKGVPYVVSGHGFFELDRYAEINGFGRVRSMLADIAVTRPFRKVVSGATAIFALSDFDRELVATMGVGPDRVHLVTNGVNEFYLHPPTPEETRHARSKFKLSPSLPKVLFMGSLHAYKGVGVFLRSLPQIRGEFQPILAGRFKSEQEKAQLISDAGLDPDTARRVIFTGGVSNAELRALYHEADVFVYPTMGDTLPLVVLEAMASSLPVVSTTVAGIPFAVQPDCGILTQPGEAAPVGEAVSRLLEDPGLRRRMGTRARHRVETVFRWEAAARCAVEAYRCVLGQGGQRNADALAMPSQQEEAAAS